MNKTTELQCSSCGAEGTASCDCGVAYVPAGKRAEQALAANPEKSDRAIAEEIGVDHKTVAKARARTGDSSPVDKRTGKDGKQRKLPEATKEKPKAKAAALVAAEPRKPPKADPNVIKQAGTFHTELMKYTAEFCTRVKEWHADSRIDEESHACVVQALEFASMRLQQAAQDIDGR